MQLIQTLRQDLNAIYRAASERHSRQVLNLSLHGRHWRLYSNANLYIALTEQCNARCRHCIGAYDPQSLPPRSNTRFPLDKLKDALSWLKPLAPSVSLVGGEPTLDCNLMCETLHLLSEMGVRKQVLDTNGTGLCQAALREVIAASNLQHINITRDHDDEAVNQRLMDIHPLFTNKDLRAAIGEMPRFIQVRMQACLDREGLCTASDCRRYLDWALSMGVHAVAFSEFARVPANDVYSRSIARYTRQNRVELNPILMELDEDAGFQPITQVAGPSYYEEIYRYQDIPVVFRSSDFGMEKVNLPPNFIDYLVFHPDGTLSGSWNPREKTLVP